MKKLTLIIMGLVVCFMAGNLIAAEAEDVVYKQEDKSIALRVKNTFDEKVRIVIDAGDGAGNYVVVGSISNNIDWAGLTPEDISGCSTSLAAVVNSETNTGLVIDTECSLDADSTDDELLDAQDITIQPGDWGNILWDTGTHLSFDVYIPGSKVGGTAGPKTIKGIYGNLGGTGNITVNIYKDQVEKYERVIVSPVYLLSAGSPLTNTAAADVIGPAQIDIEMDFPVKNSENCLIRAARASSATTGSLGVKVQSK